jgi:hypothetical protein
MKVMRKNSTITFLTHAKRITLAFLIMASFTLAIANIHFADAQRIEFILQFGTPEEDSATIALDVSSDQSGNVYVVGITTGTLPDQTSEGGQDAFIRKYDSDGDEIWTRQFGTSDDDSAQGVSVDSSSGDVYVVGNTRGTLPDQTSEGGQDAFIRKYDSDGDEIWTQQFGTSEFDVAQGVSTDSSGDAYVAGSTSGTFPDQTGEEYVFAAFIRKYDSDGDEIWTRQFEIGEGLLGRGVSTDSSGGVYLAGIQAESAFAFVQKYNLDGDEIWTRQFDTASSEDNVHGVSADSSGGVYVVGDTEGTFPGQTQVGFTDAFLAKLVDEDDDKGKKHHDDKEKHHDDNKRKKH